MTLPQIAIVGRPNVGKSSLLNRLARRKVSIVDPTPGVTRDRVSLMLELDPPVEEASDAPTRLVEIVDTGGYGVYVAEGGRFDEIGADLTALTPDIEHQIKTAREQAALILFVIDAQSGLTSLDETVAQILRQEGSADKVVVVANKVDGDSWVAHGLEAAGLGFGEPVCVSATSGYGMRRMRATMYNGIRDVDGSAESDPEMKLAIVGRRNAGKSTLINALAGEPRVIVSEITGTTRDSIDVRFELDGHSMIAIDTAGLRKRKSFAGDIEYYAYHRMLQSIRRADVVFLMVDASTEVSGVDKKLALELQRQYKPTIIVVNKSDLVEDKIQPEDYLEYLTEQLRGLEYAPIVFMSAMKGEGMQDLIAMARNLYEQAGHRESTGKLNSVIKDILGKRGPSSRLGTQAKLYYATQVSTHPPTVVLAVNSPKLFKGGYERYLMNRLREELPYSEVPIRLLVKPRDRKSVHEMKSAAWSREYAERHAPEDDFDDEDELAFSEEE